jgi:light-regulated signal transduction histidine kinase (bacteriophytochrome)
MKTLIKELLDFSRVGRKDQPFEKLNLDELIQEVIIDFHLYIEETEAEIIIEENMPEIYGIRVRIKQLFHNVISNALKFRSSEKPKIFVSCCDEKNCWMFCISDNGRGIDPEYFERIFGLFKRLYSRDEYPGTGIGLALCKKIVETHGGKIWVDSKVDGGTSMYFTISKSIKVDI